MAKRTVIEINEDLCNGCGLCAAGCPEGALQIIDGKARLVGESLCDGLGACIGECPQNAIEKTEREAEPYSERSVIENIIPKGMNTILAHLRHLKHHGQVAWASSEQSERPAQVAWASSEQSERPAQVAWASSEQSERPTQVAWASSEQSERPAQVAWASSEQSERPAQVAWASSEQSERPAQDSWYKEALEILAEKGIAVQQELDSYGSKSGMNITPAAEQAAHLKPAGTINPMAHASATHHGGCPGSAMRSFKAAGTQNQAAPSGAVAQGSPESTSGASMRSKLEQWPIQLHLVNPRAPYFKGEHLLIAADCTAFACGAFHAALLAGKKLIIACPKLDSNKEIYVDKIKALIDDSEISEITLAIMEVPCCGGLSAIVGQALRETRRKIPVSTVVVSIEGGTLAWQ